MADDDFDNDETDETDDEQQGIPTPSSVAAPTPEEEQDLVQSQYRNPMENAPRPTPAQGGPGWTMPPFLTDILNYASLKWQNRPQAIPTEETPGELGPEAKKYIDEGKTNFSAGIEKAKNIENTRLSDISEGLSAAAKGTGKAAAAVPGLATQTLTPSPAEGSIIAQGFAANQQDNDFHPGDYAQGAPEKPAAMKRGEAAASAQTRAANAFATDPTGSLPPSVAALEEIRRATEKAGLDAGLGILQAHRRGYDAIRHFGVVALEHDNMTTAIDAANQAYKSVPGLNTVSFTQGRNNTVTGTVTDFNGRTESYALPQHKFMQLLKNGDFDLLLEMGNAAGVEALGAKIEKPQEILANPSSRYADNTAQAKPTERNARGELMIPAAKIIRPLTEREQESAEKEKAATATQEGRERIERIRGENSVARERARSEGIEKWKREQVEGREREAQIKAAKGGDLEARLRQDLLAMSRRNPPASQKELDVYRQRFYQINGMTPPQQPVQPTQPQAQGGYWLLNPEGKTPRERWQWQPAQ